MCKPHKGNGMKGKEEYQTRQEKVARISEKEQRQERPSCPDCGSVSKYDPDTGECTFCMIMFGV